MSELALSWTAIVPMKQGGARKSRLAPDLSLPERVELDQHMSQHVLACLRSTPAILRIIQLSPAEPIEASHDWVRDRGRGLNAELEALRGGISPLLVIHGDLPLLQTADLEALLHAAEAKGVAIAPDRHGLGTNAVAVADDRPFRFAFGEGSARAHQVSAAGAAAWVMRDGLSHDVDTPVDLQLALAKGFDPDLRPASLPLQPAKASWP